MLELKHISYAVREGDSELGILNDISLTIDDHRLVVFTGPNGGGKTTLAKIIMGLVKPTGGQILWNGQDITDLGITERARLGISYGFQQPPRFKGLTVRNLLTIASGNEKLSKDQCCQYLTKVGLCANDYLDREVDASLSGGEVKRIEIATILARSSQLMIFDEPEAGIDLWSFARLTETFEQIHASGTATMIIISHQERIISLADEIIVVGDGELRHRGTPEEILPQILADTLSGCPVLTKVVIPPNKRNGRKQEQHLQLARGIRALKEQMGENVVGGGRPDKAKIVEEWRTAHPEGTPKDCIADTGISKNTVYKWWSVGEAL